MDPQEQAFAVQHDHFIDLRQIFLAVKRRKKIVAVTFASFLALSGGITLFQLVFSPVFKGSFTLLIADPINTQASTSSSDGNDALFEQLARNTTDADLPTLAEFLRSPLVLDPIAKRFMVRGTPLSSRLKITTGGSKDEAAKGIITVTLSSNNPNRDRPLLLAICQAYLQFALDQRQKRLTDGIAFLDSQAPALQAKADQIQSELADFRRSNLLLEPIKEGMSLKSQETKLTRQIFAFEAERNRLKTVREEISTGKLKPLGFRELIATGPIGSSVNAAGYGSKSGGLAVGDPDQSLIEQITTVESDLASARSKFQPDSFLVKSLEARLNQLKPLSQANQMAAVDTALTLNQGRLETAIAQKLLLNEQFLKQPLLIKEFQSLQNRLDIAQENLVGLVRAREAFQLQTAQQSDPWTLISPPKFKSKPASPSPSRNLFLGALLGLVSGIGFGLLRDRLDDVFFYPREVKKAFAFPFLGHIPFLGNSYRPESSIGALSQPVEHSFSSFKSPRELPLGLTRNAFCGLYSSLRFSSEQCNFYLVSSASSGDGKSLVAALFAQALAALGQRVLLIDAEFNSPSIHSWFGVENVLGLSDYLVDNQISSSRIIHKVEGFHSLSVISSGSAFSDESCLFPLERFKELVAQLSDSSSFDVVLIDAPEFQSSSYVSLIAQCCSGLLFLVSLCKANKKSVSNCLNSMSVSGIPVSGLITNYPYDPGSLVDLNEDPLTAALVKSDLSSPTNSVSDAGNSSESGFDSFFAFKFPARVSSLLLRSASRLNRYFRNFCGWIDS